jgi:hypothetical protein
MRHQTFWKWLVVTMLLDICQFALFDGNGMVPLSLLFGIPFFGAVVWTPMRWFAVCSDETLSVGRKVVSLVVHTILGLGIAIPSGIFLLFTHICA